MADLSRRLAAEAAGTCLLVATVVGSGLMAERLTADVALQLLCNALATAAMLGVLISLLQPISGAHFNPVVSLVMGLRGALGWRHVPAYAAAQVGGGIAGTWLVHLMFGEPVLQVAGTVRWGAGLWIAEAVAAFGLVAVILLGARRATPVLVAAYVGAAYWFTSSTSFANPAVTIARMLSDSFSGIRPGDGAAFIVAQIVGGLLAMAAARWLAATPERSRRTI
jgi:glycerol uptake facilitator-like aquaporin